MSVSVESKKVAGEILVAAIQTKIISPSGSDQEKAKAISEAFKIIALAVSNPAGATQD